MKQPIPSNRDQPAATATSSEGQAMSVKAALNSPLFAR